MTFDQFIQSWIGRKVDTDGTMPSQCMDLMHRYLMDVYGLPSSYLGAPTAYQAFLNYKGTEFKRVDVPQKGDIVFWNTGVGPSGHVAIFYSNDGSTFTSFDANWPVGSLPHLQKHDWHNIAGYLRKGGTMDPTLRRDIDYINNTRLGAGGDGLGPRVVKLEQAKPAVSQFTEAEVAKLRAILNLFK